MFSTERFGFNLTEFIGFFVVVVKNALHTSMKLRVHCTCFQKVKEIFGKSRRSQNIMKVQC